jgi:CubicO group peptidase (beta-lactamase class C family)
MKSRSIIAGVLVALLSIWADTAGAGAPEPLPAGDSLQWTPDQQIVGYREIARLRPGRTIARGSHVHGLPIAVHQISPRWVWKGETMDVDRYMEAQRTSGLIVLKDGAVILERYAFGRTAKDRWQSQSVAKGVTSLLVGAAVQDGYIKSLDSQVTTYVPELKGSAYDGVTLRQLLTMTSGVKWNEDYTDAKSDEVQMFSQPFVPGVDPVISWARHLSRANQPGSNWLYKGMDPEIAARIVSRATGRSLSEYLSEKLWAPYGMDTDAFWVVDPAGHEYASCCIQATLRDFARIGEFMLEGGRAGDVQVLPSDYIAEATSARAPGFTYYTAGATGYGYYWGALKDGYLVTGLQGQAIIVFPKDKLVIAINSFWPNERNWDAYVKARDAFTEQRVGFIEAVRQAAQARAVGPVRTDCEEC